MNLVLQAARERHGVEIRHRADAERREGVFQLALALQVLAALLALDTVNRLGQRLARSQPQRGGIFRRQHAGESGGRVF